MQNAKKFWWNAETYQLTKGLSSRKRSFSRLVLNPVDVVLPGEPWLGVARPHSCLRASVLGAPEVVWMSPGAKWNCCFLSLAYSHISLVRQSGPGGRARKGFQDERENTKKVWGIPRTFYGTSRSLYGTARSFHGRPRSSHGTPRSFYGTSRSFMGYKRRREAFVQYQETKKLLCNTKKLYETLTNFIEYHEATTERSHGTPRSF